MTNYTDPHRSSAFHFMMCQNTKRPKNQHGKYLLSFAIFALCIVYAYYRAPELFDSLWARILAGQGFWDTIFFAFFSSFISLSLASLVKGKSLFGSWRKTLFGYICFFLSVWVAITWLF